MNRRKRLFPGPGRPDRFSERPVLPKLRMANQLFEQNEFQAAAALYEDFAEEAERREGPRAHVFWIQAARCRAMTGEAQQSLNDFKRGFEIMADRQNRQQEIAVRARVLRELSLAHQEDLADQLESWLDERFGKDDGLQPTSPFQPENPPGRKPYLPPSCPNCGGPVNPGEIVWLDSRSAVCDYCGNRLTSEEL